MIRSPVLPGPREGRADSLADLLVGFEAYFDEHRACGEIAGGIVEMREHGVAWTVAWMTCARCGMRWERRRAV